MPLSSATLTTDFLVGLLGLGWAMWIKFDLGSDRRQRR